MTRRDALLRLSALFGGTIFGANRFLTGTANAADAPGTTAFLSADDLALLNEVGETIIPTTPASAGARAADVASLMQETVRDFYDDRERAVFREGLVALRAARFASLASADQHALLLALDRITPQPEYYCMLKQLTIWATSLRRSTPRRRSSTSPSRARSRIASTSPPAPELGRTESVSLPARRRPGIRGGCISLSPCANYSFPGAWST